MLLFKKGWTLSLLVNRLTLCMYTYTYSSTMHLSYTCNVVLSYCCLYDCPENRRSCYYIRRVFSIVARKKFSLERSWASFGSALVESWRDGLSETAVIVSGLSEVANQTRAPSPNRLFGSLTTQLSLRAEFSSLKNRILRPCPMQLDGTFTSSPYSRQFVTDIGHLFFPSTNLTCHGRPARIRLLFMEIY